MKRKRKRTKSKGTAQTIDGGRKEGRKKKNVTKKGIQLHTENREESSMDTENILNELT